MKTKYVRSNTCARCGNKAGMFIWSSSRQIHAGIRVMYQDSKICLTCYEEMKQVYPEVRRESTNKCPLCGGEIKAWCRGVGEMTREDYCLDCGYVEDGLK